MKNSKATRDGLLKLSNSVPSDLTDTWSFLDGGQNWNIWWLAMQAGAKVERVSWADTFYLKPPGGEGVISFLADYLGIEKSDVDLLISENDKQFNYFARKAFIRGVLLGLAMKTKNTSGVD